MRDELLKSVIEDANRLHATLEAKKQEWQAQRDLITTKKNDLGQLVHRIEVLEQAKTFLISLNRYTQEKIKERIENLLTLALNDIFQYPYRVRLDFDIKRNQSEITPVLIDGTMELSPEEVGGGIVDVLSFSMRVILWFINAEKTDSILVLDEPFKFLSKEYHPNASTLLKRLSDMFQIQFIVITHEDLLIHNADNALRVTRREQISRVESL